MRCIAWILILLLLSSEGQPAILWTPQDPLQKCEPINVPLCKSMNYNVTRLPNYWMQTSQKDVQQSINVYDNLVKTQCSSQLVFFLCTLYLPICIVNMSDVRPCRSVCQKVRRECIGVVQKFRKQWPDTLDCDLFPDYKTAICVKPEAFVDEDGAVKEKEEKPTCPACPTSANLTMQTYTRNKYNYAIVGEVISFTTTPTGETITTVFVRAIITQHDVKIKTGPMRLWSNSTCVCPPISVDKLYVIAGHEDSVSDKLMLGSDSIVHKIHSDDVARWEAKIKKWIRKTSHAKRSTRRQNRGQRKNKRNKQKRLPGGFRWIRLK